VTPEVHAEIERLLASLKIEIVSMSSVRDEDSWDAMWCLLVSAGGRYACFAVAPTRNIAFAPDYAGNGRQLLVTAISQSGVTEILDWTNRATAVRRYTALMANEEYDSVTRVTGGPLFPQRDK
jgi:hypothetical protein